MTAENASGGRQNGENDSVLTIKAPEGAGDELPAGTVGDPYVTQLNADGGSGGYRWELVSHPPSWLNLDPRTGIISGLPGPKASGTISLTFKVTDSSGQSTLRILRLNINPEPRIYPDELVSDYPRAQNREGLDSPLSIAETSEIIAVTAETSRLLQLDEVWTTAVVDGLRSEESADPIDHIRQLEMLHSEMRQLLLASPYRASAILRVANRHFEKGRVL